MEYELLGGHDQAPVSWVGHSCVCGSPGHSWQEQQDQQEYRQGEQVQRPKPCADNVIHFMPVPEPSWNNSQPLGQEIVSIKSCLMFDKSQETGHRLH
jgi:hypothetical protein